MSGKYCLVALADDGSTYHVSVEGTPREQACREVIHIALAEGRHILNIWDYCPDQSELN